MPCIICVIPTFSLDELNPLRRLHPKLVGEGSSIDVPLAIDMRGHELEGFRYLDEALVDG